ncbi:MAG: phytanoyl-CoA dioxygenase family protein [Planctomycetota bacterium]
MTQPALELDPAAAYAAHGFARLPALLDPDEVAALRALLEAAPLPEPGPYGLLVHQVRELAPALAPWLERERLAAPTRAVLGLEAVVLFQDHYLSKPPGAGRLSWHQDHAYWPLDEVALGGAMMWLTLDDADEENGCLSFVPGSHAWGPRQPASFVPGADLPQKPGLLPIDAAGREVVSAPCAAGDAILNHPLVWHASPPNRSRRPRRALGLTWVPPGARFDPDHAPHPWNFRPDLEKGAPLPASFPRFAARERA